MERALWRDVEQTLEEFVPYYERVNLAATLGLLPLWRREAAGHGRGEDVALEIGPATGGFARLLPCRRVYLLEPSGAMAHYARRRLPLGRYLLLQGVAEAIPLGPSVVDRVFCSFSFRDFVDKEGACREILRVLRPGGEVHVLDVTRPPRGWRRYLLDAWIGRGAAGLVRFLVPPRALQGWRENPYTCFLRTYKACPSLPHIEGMFRRQGFRGVLVRSLGLQGIFHLRAVKPSTT